MRSPCRSHGDFRDLRRLREALLSHPDGGGCEGPSAAPSKGWVFSQDAALFHASTTWQLEDWDQRRSLRRGPAGVRLVRRVWHPHLAIRLPPAILWLGPPARQSPTRTTRSHWPLAYIHCLALGSESVPLLRTALLSPDFEPCRLLRRVLPTQLLGRVLLFSHWEECCFSATWNSAAYSATQNRTSAQLPRRALPLSSPEQRCYLAALNRAASQLPRTALLLSYSDECCYSATQKTAAYSATKNSAATQLLTTPMLLSCLERRCSGYSAPQQSAATQLLRRALLLSYSEECCLLSLVSY